MARAPPAASTVSTAAHPPGNRGRRSARPAADRALWTRTPRPQHRRRPAGIAHRDGASLLVALDVHPRVAMQILRHSQSAVTMGVYSEVPSSATREALRRLGESLAA